MMKSKTPYWNLEICPGLSVCRRGWRLHIRKDMRCSEEVGEEDHLVNLSSIYYYRMRMLFRQDILYVSGQPFYINRVALVQ